MKVSKFHLNLSKGSNPIQILEFVMVKSSVFYVFMYKSSYSIFRKSEYIPEELNKFYIFLHKVIKDVYFSA